MPASSTYHRTDPWRPALSTGLFAVLIPVAVCAVAAAAATQHLGLDTLRVGARAWLLAVGSSIEFDGSRVTVLPLGGTAVAALAAAVVAAVTARNGVDDAMGFGAVSGGAAGALAAVLSAVTSTSTVSTSFVRAAFGAFIVVGFGTVVSLAVRHPGSLRVPARVRPFGPALGAGLRAAGIVFVLVFVLVMMVAASRVRVAADLWAALDPGYGGGLVLALVCLLSLPTVVAWALAVVLGPGIALGADTRIDVTGVDVGALPAFPPLAVLPEPGPFADSVVAVMAVPVLVAAWAGWRLVDALATARLFERLGHAALAGAVAGLLLALVAISGHGAIGPGLLAEAGPPVLTTLMVAMTSMSVGGALGAVASHYRGARADSE
ncbi:DUF6350 family protein [uncultured Aeromicrobium sp.]|uniref:cell division protein PerM n=1 Tax=uncultured Aeromicrobium sp. TaxID=337820 RepID=UPI0025FD71DB|nr:DUF6350 family protein [uncultured Aeromicrobium sp.]